MPKKLFAVTNLKFSADPSEFINAGDEVPTDKFTKEQLIELHDAGAIEVKVVDEEPKGKERPGPLDDPDVEVVDETAAGKAKAEKDAAKAEADSKAAAEKEAAAAAKTADTPEVKAAKAEDAKAAEAAAAAGAAAAPKTTPAPATTKPEDKK